MLATFIWSVRKGPVPTERTHADFGTVVRADNLPLQELKMAVAHVGGGGFAGPAAAGARVGDGVEQIVLFFVREIAEGTFVSAHSFAVEVTESVKERALVFRLIGGENQINITVGESFLRARSIGRGNDEIAEDDQSLVL